MARLSVQFINENFFRWARPHPAHGGICGEVYFMYAAAGNLRRIPPCRDPAEKRPFMDGHYLAIAKGLWQRMFFQPLKLVEIKINMYSDQ